MHVRLAFNGKTWPKNTPLNLRGELPTPFDATPTAPTLPFEVAILALPKKGFPDAQLVSPRPSLWVKWVRVFRVPASGAHQYPYEADIMLAGRRAKIRHFVGGLPRFLDETNKEVAPRGSGGYGDMSGLGITDSNLGDLEFAHSPFEFSFRRMGWDEAFGMAVPNEFLRQRIEYGGREPLQITFPITRGGVALEGNIPDTDWKIESPAPPSN